MTYPLWPEIDVYVTGTEQTFLSTNAHGIDYQVIVYTDGRTLYRAASQLSRTWDANPPDKEFMDKLFGDRLMEALL